MFYDELDNMKLNECFMGLLLSSNIRSEGSIAIVKKFDFDYFMVFDSISLPHSKKVF